MKFYAPAVLSRTVRGTAAAVIGIIQHIVSDVAVIIVFTVRYRSSGIFEIVFNTPAGILKVVFDSSSSILDIVFEIIESAVNVAYDA